MVKHYNPSIAEDANRLLNSKAGDQLGAEVAPIIQPTIELRRYSNIVRSGSSTASSSTASIFTTPSDKDFYLTGATFSLQKDATSDNTSAFLRVTIDGSTTRNIIQMDTLTTTAVSKDMAVSFPFPIKLDRSTNVIIGATYTVGSLVRNATIFGYTVEVTK